MNTKQAAQDEPLASEATQKRSGCQHHWVIDPPKGPVSKGCAGAAEKSATFQTTSRAEVAGALRVEILVAQVSMRRGESNRGLICSA